VARDSSAVGIGTGDTIGPNPKLCGSRFRNIRVAKLEGKISDRKGDWVSVTKKTPKERKEGKNRGRAPDDVEGGGETISFIWRTEAEYRLKVKEERLKNKKCTWPDLGKMRPEPTLDTALHLDGKQVAGGKNC